MSSVHCVNIFSGGVFLICDLASGVRTLMDVTRSRRKRGPSLIPVTSGFALLPLALPYTFPFSSTLPCDVFFRYCYWRCWLRLEIMFIGNSEVLMLKLIVVRALKHPLLWQLLTSSFFLLNCSTIHQLLQSCSFKLSYTMSTFVDINKFVNLYNSAQFLNYSLFTNYLARKMMMAVVTKFQILPFWSQNCWFQTMFMIKLSRLQ